MCGLSAAALAAAFFMPTPAAAGTLQCVPREALFDSRRTSHGEVPALRGVTASGALFEVLVSPEGSFTVLFSFPDGLTCPVATGEAWRNVRPTPADPAACHGGERRRSRAAPAGQPEERPAAVPLQPALAGDAQSTEEPAPAGLRNPPPPGDG